MQESTLKRLRLLPVVAALLAAVVVSWSLLTPRKRVLVFATGSPSGVYHRLASLMKQAIEADHPDVVIQLRPSQGSADNLKLLDGGEAQLALAQNDGVGGQAVRSLVAVYPEMLHLIRHTHSGIQALNDVSGKRIGIGAAGSGTESLTTALLEFAGVTLDPEQTARVPFTEALRQLEAHELDAAFFLVGVGGSTIDRALANEKLSLTPLHTRFDTQEDPERTAHVFTDGFRVRYPHVSPHTIPLMAYRGRPPSPIPTVGVRAVLVCHDNLDADVTERITRTLFERRAALSRKETSFAHLDEQRAQANLQFPLHQGAENYYRRRDPGFLSEHAESMGFIVTLMLLGWSVLAWVQRWYVQSRKNRIDTFYQAVNDVMRRLQTDATIETIDALEAELLDVRQRAAAELVNEQLAADESYVIYQNMVNGCQLLLSRARDKFSEAGSD
ncbi:MAG: TAXI family TRAP transporter solute-binding subunit [Planctomycetaceae bacterium]